MPNSNTLTNIVIGTVSGFVGGVLGVVSTLYVLSGEPKKEPVIEAKPAIYNSQKDLNYDILKEAIESGRWKKRPDYDEYKF